MKHVLDAMWTYVEMDDIETSDEDGYYEDSPRYKHLIAFAEAISPVRKMDFRQQAAVYAIRGVLTSNPGGYPGALVLAEARCCVSFPPFLVPGSQIWIQKAVHLNPSEAQWVIDLAYAVWDEDPEEPGPDEPDHLDASLTARGVALIAQGSSPSHNAKVRLERRGGRGAVRRDAALNGSVARGTSGCAAAGLQAVGVRPAGRPSAGAAAPQVDHGPGADSTDGALPLPGAAQEEGLVPPGRLQEQEEVHLRAGLDQGPAQARPGVSR